MLYSIGNNNTQANRRATECEFFTASRGGIVAMGQPNCDNNATTKRLQRDFTARIHKSQLHTTTLATDMRVSREGEDTYGNFNNTRGVLRDIGEASRRRRGDAPRTAGRVSTRRDKAASHVRQRPACRPGLEDRCERWRRIRLARDARGRRKEVFLEKLRCKRKQRQGRGYEPTAL